MALKVPSSMYQLPESPATNFFLANLDQLPDDFQEFFYKNIVDEEVLNHLEINNMINYWKFGEKLYPMVAPPDGNCLLHSASLGVFGFTDFTLTLRLALQSFFLNSPYTDRIKNRYRIEENINVLQPTGLQWETEDFEREWKEQVLERVSCSPSTSNTASRSKTNGNFYGKYYQSLQEIHIFGLAHVLRRPIIVVADNELRDIQNIHFRGIYLPVELAAEIRLKCPVILCYYNNHVVPLINMVKSSSRQAAILPITTYELKYVQTASKEESYQILQDYVDLVEVDSQGEVRVATSTSTNICALLHRSVRHALQDTNFMKIALERFEEAKAVSEWATASEGPVVRTEGEAEAEEDTEDEDAEKEEAEVFEQMSILEINSSIFDEEKSECWKASTPLQNKKDSPPQNLMILDERVRLTASQLKNRDLIARAGLTFKTLEIRYSEVKNDNETKEQYMNRRKNEGIALKKYLQPILKNIPPPPPPPPNVARPFTRQIARLQKEIDGLQL